MTCSQQAMKWIRRESALRKRRKTAQRTKLTVLIEPERMTKGSQMWRRRTGSTWRRQR